VVDEDTRWGVSHGSACQTGGYLRQFQFIPGIHKAHQPRHIMAVLCHSSCSIYCRVQPTYLDYDDRKNTAGHERLNALVRTWPTYAHPQYF